MGAVTSNFQILSSLHLITVIPSLGDRNELSIKVENVYWRFRSLLSTDFDVRNLNRLWTASEGAFDKTARKTVYTKIVDYFVVDFLVSLDTTCNMYFTILDKMAF